MKKRIILANDHVAIDLHSIITFLNECCSYFKFEKYEGEIDIEDTIITPETFKKLGLKRGDDVNLIMVFTDKQYYNNYFYEIYSGVIITSFFSWEYLTTLPKNNGATYFIVDLLTLKIDHTFRHSVNDVSKPECIFDFLTDKRGIDSSMRASLICPQCNNRIKKAINTTDEINAFEDIKKILNEIGNASKWDLDIISYWEKKSPKVTNAKKKKSVFISYSHADAKWLKRLKVHLKPFERESLIEIWEDTRIQTGDYWKIEIKRALEKSHSAILLVSADFLASDFIMENELPQLLQLAFDHGTRIFQLIVGPCFFNETEQLSKFQAVNSVSNPLIRMDYGDQESLFFQLATGIIAHAKKDG
jgi:hypothetical protein